MDVTEGLIYLCRCAVNEIVPEKEIVDGLDLDAVYREASRHKIAAMTGMALESAGVHTPYFKRAIAAAQRKTLIFEKERLTVFRELDRAGIWHLPLKGAILKDWYPRMGMRESADIDVLFDKSREEEVRDMMVSMGYTIHSYGKGHHDVYLKKPVTNFQMHTELFGDGYPQNLNRYYDRVKDKLVRKNGYEFSFTPIDFYLYNIAHEWRHYRTAGTGLRSVLDTYVMMKKLDLPWDSIKAETEKLGLTTFEEKNRALALHLFGLGEKVEADQEMFEYIVESGAYGTLSHRVKKRNQGTWRQMEICFLPAVSSYGNR